MSDCYRCELPLPKDPKVRSCPMCGAVIPACDPPPQPGDDKPVDAEGVITWGHIFGRKGDTPG